MISPSIDQVKKAADVLICETPTITGRPFIVVDRCGRIVSWHIPGALSPRLQKVAEAAWSQLLVDVPNLLSRLDLMFGHEEYAQPQNYAPGMVLLSPCCFADSQSQVSTSPIS